MVFNDNVTDEDDSSLLYSPDTAPVILPYDSKLYELLHKTDMPYSILRGHYKYSFYRISQGVQNYIAQKQLFDPSNSCIVFMRQDIRRIFKCQKFYVIRIR